MLDQAPGLTLTVAGDGGFCRYGDSKLVDLLFRAILGEEEWSFRHAVSEAECTLNSKVISAVAGPLAVNLEKSFLYAGRDFWHKGFTTHIQHLLVHVRFVERRPISARAALAILGHIRT
jgi:hypothetical protein